jgi:hypothetical protein
MDKLNDTILCYQQDSHAKPQHEDPSREIDAQISQPTFAKQKIEFTTQR